MASVEQFVKCVKMVRGVFFSKQEVAVLPSIKLSRLFNIKLNDPDLAHLLVYLDTYEPRAAAASNEVLDYLLAPDADVAVGSDFPKIAESIRHLVVAAEHKKYKNPPEPVAEETEEEEVHEEVDVEVEEEEEDKDADEDAESEGEYEVYTFEESEPEEDIDVAAFHQRLPDLFKKTRNLQSVDYHNFPGLPISAENVELLAGCERLRTFGVDSAIRPTSWNSTRSFEDPEIWDLQYRTISVIPRSIDNIFGPTLYLPDNAPEPRIIRGRFASYGNLTHLKMNITEGIWDWDGRGSPQRGATGDYIFPSLRLPALRRFELVGGYWYIDKIQLFEAFSAADFPVLSHLEIKDSNNTANNERLRWRDSTNPSGYKQEGRYFLGLVQPFLSSRSGLTSLWVDENALLPCGNGEGDGLAYGFCTVRELWNSDSLHFVATDKGLWRATLHSVLFQLESLRVGFGTMDHTEVGLVLRCCDPEKLSQFGFEWAWHGYGRDDPIAPELLVHLRRFPKLTDVHILFPRPETQLSGAPDPVIDPRTIRDVASIFRCNGSICRVGIGNSVVWERHYAPQSDGPPEIMLVSDGSVIPNAAVPRFYHAGHMAKYTPRNETPWVHDDNTVPMRPQRSEKIEQLRDLLKRILD
ncbi:hypothetical protein C8R44DRAFT_728813 [Mycena epipterygia]|nr:hypothetical protein C8R44DRAFT_728813 [Mycena epipterygia]